MVKHISFKGDLGLVRCVWSLLFMYILVLALKHHTLTETSNRLIQCKGRHSPFLCFGKQVKESVLSCMGSTGFYVSVNRLTFRSGNSTTAHIQYVNIYLISKLPSLIMYHLQCPFRYFSKPSDSNLDYVLLPIDFVTKQQWCSCNLN